VAVDGSSGGGCGGGGVGCGGGGPPQTAGERAYQPYGALRATNGAIYLSIVPSISLAKSHKI
jgi:hypothetical protein